MRQRLVEDTHVRATALFGEAQESWTMGASRPTLERHIRDRGLRPRGHAFCSSGAHVDIEHPPGEEIHVGLAGTRETPWGAVAFVPVGSIAAGPGVWIDRHCDDSAASPSSAPAVLSLAGCCTGAASTITPMGSRQARGAVRL